VEKILKAPEKLPPFGKGRPGGISGAPFQKGKSIQQEENLADGKIRTGCDTITKKTKRGS
jgi:hypothetical protein